MMKTPFDPYAHDKKLDIAQHYAYILQLVVYINDNDYMVLTQGQSLQIFESYPIEMAISHEFD